jgi:hypothetical protein
VEGTAVEKVMWLVLGATVIVASVFAGRSERARLVARVALGVLFLVFGAMVNVIYLVTDWNSFAEFGEMSQFAFGWWLWLYAVPMLGALTLLLRAERRHQPDPAPPRQGARGAAGLNTGSVVDDGGADVELSGGRSR